ncbi:cyclase family protein [Streptomyces ipomoeae]|uniref:cyclase family protein n=1 Tax=Streptomyces ipomoeae TaxID=103232 RepID=UPI0029A27D20|nr:cyclase family protein [Streptomyces ipomoeae]MDX2826327.1 cyclase family protein [Streptomyces ipomoeae]MDX2879096.1 cyclase family protein [Streptomyces ipomoeae]
MGGETMNDEVGAIMNSEAGGMRDNGAVRNGGSGVAGVDSPGDGQWRVRFDAEVTFANGGGLQTQGFRLDVADPEIGDGELAELFVRHLGLLMVEEVRISGREAVREPHKGSRHTMGTGTADSGAAGYGAVGSRGDSPTGVRDAAPGSVGTARRIIDLSHPIHHGMITYPGLPGPEIGDHLTRTASRDIYAPGTEFAIGRIAMVSNTGTYVDSPFHRYGDGPDLAGLPLTRLTDLDGIVVRVLDGGDGGDGGNGDGADANRGARRAVNRELLLPHDVTGKAVLIHTGWSRHFGTEQYGHGHPYLTADATAWLVEQGAALVGIDSLNIDDTDDGTRPAHTGLLAAGIPVVEHLRGLEALPPQGFRFHAAPPAVAGMGTFPVRAYALLDHAR